MALQQTINISAGTDLSFKYTDFGFCVKNSMEVLENVYIKIKSIIGDKNKIRLDIGIYDKKDGILITTDIFEFIPDVSSTATNFIQQGYEQLKTNKYIDAIDLLD